MKILVCGDFTTTGRGRMFLQKGVIVDSGIREHIESADFSIVNLESPVYDGVYGGISKVGGCLKTTAVTISYLKSIGFSAVCLANNHFYDYGEYGVKSTIDTLEKYGMQYVGGGIGDTIQKALMVNNDVAILNYCESEFSVMNPHCGSNAFSPVKAFYDINELKNKGIKHIIVITHGGHEHYNLPSPRMKELYRFLIDLGADMVINHHQHCFSGMEEYKDKAIFYGIGNFFFDYNLNIKNKKDIWDTGFMVELIILDDKLNYNLIPYVQCADSDCCVKTRDQISFNSDLAKLNEIIADDKKLENCFMNYVDSQKGNMMAWFAPYENRILMALVRRHLIPSFLTESKKKQILNAIRCESHRDVCLRLFQKL